MRVGGGRGLEAGGAREHRVRVALTRCRTGELVTFSKFDGLHHLVTGLVAGAAIPPSFHPFDMIGRRGRATFPVHHGFRLQASECEATADDEWYVDGGIASAAGPDFDPALRTLVVTPISGGGVNDDRISPRDPTSSWVPDLTVAGLRVQPSLRNLRRMQLSVTADEAALADQFARGTDDGHEWLETLRSRAGGS